MIFSLLFLRLRRREELDSRREMVEEREVADLYLRYGPALYRRCLSLVRQEDDARELVQEVFLQFWRGRKRFEGRSSPFTFLYRIATNLSIDRLRRRTTAGVHSSLQEDCHSSRGERADGRSLALSELAALTEGLDAETLTVAVMSHVDGLTQDEIAEALGRSRRTIGKKLKRFASHTGERVRGLSEVLMQS